MFYKNIYIRLFTLIIAIVLLHKYAPTPLKYPNTKMSNNISDKYHGKEIEDEYRWLEDENSSQTEAWIQKQNAFTNRYIRKISFRKKIEKRLTDLWNYPTISLPFKKGKKVYFYKNNGLQNQSILYAKNRIEDADSSAKVIIDPNNFSKDGGTSLSGIYFSNDNKYLGYAISNSGSDWREFFIKDLSTGKNLSDHLEWIKFSGMSWAESGFYYNAFPKPTDGRELSDINQSSKVFFHKLGTSQSDDSLIFSDLTNPKISNYPSTTNDGRFLIIYRTKGTYGNALLVKDLNNADSEFVSIVDDFTSEIDIIDNIGGKLIAITDRNAAKKKVVLIDFKNPNEKNWVTTIPENNNILTSVNLVNDKLVAHYMVNVLSSWIIHDINGEIIKKVELPGPGISYGFHGNKGQSVSWYVFESLVHPPTIFMYDFESLISSTYYESKAKFDKNRFIMKQDFYFSKDGTRIPIFIAHEKKLVLDNMAPTLLYGYGGFNISEKPYFNKTIPVILENGGVYAIACIRGGGEYGQDWHSQGMLSRKQNVFDDFISAAEFLMVQGFTSTEKLAIQGGSNGGTLIGAVINQRPDLFQVAFPEVGVMDMLRYEKFTIGWAWAVEFGSVENEKDFENLLSYSPLHNIKKASYPSVLIYTADHDDRVVPAHSYKYAAKLQKNQMSDANPILIRIGTKTGHGAGKSTKARIRETAEKWAFMFYEMGIKY